MDYDPPLKKLGEEFIPHSKLLVSALLSLQQVYLRRNLTAEKWRYCELNSLKKIFIRKEGVTIKEMFARFYYFESNFCMYLMKFRLSI